ncbi:hypothetical protein AQB9606_04711 [Aquabacterium sp. CECT 9606]|nr:hypothetical protein AQB9606_04711 [Aquabacterium sp. CECT 9606]
MNTSSNEFFTSAATLAPLACVSSLRWLVTGVAGMTTTCAEGVSLAMSIPPSGKAPSKSAL